MNDINYWKQFFCTGKVEDYLKYKQCAQQESVAATDDNKKKKESPYARFHQSNGNCYKD